MKTAIEPNSAPRRDSAFAKKFLAQKRAAFFVWHRSFQELGAQFFQKNCIEVKQIQTHLLPTCFATEHFNLRQLLELKQAAWGLSELWCQVVKKRLATGRSKKEFLEQAHQALLLFPFEHWPGCDTKLSIAAECQKSSLRNAAELREVLKNVLLQKGFAAESLGKSDGIAVKVSLWRDTLRVYLPLSFHEHWHRCYKNALAHVASLREDLAQCLLSQYFLWLKKWGFANQPQIFFVPFFGSGTFYFESVTLSWNVAHALIGRYDSFTCNELAPHKTLGHIKKSSLKEAQEMATNRPLTFFAQELDPKQIENFQINHQLFRAIFPTEMLDCLQFDLRNQDFFATCPSDLASLSLEHPDPHAVVHVLMNPPFGNRIQGTETSVAKYYARIGEKIAELSRTRILQGLILCPSHAAAEAFAWALAGIKPADAEQPTDLVFETFTFQFGSLDARVVHFSTHRQV